MIRELQRKMIKTTMAFFTIMLLLLLTAINIMNYYLMRRDDQRAVKQLVIQQLMKAVDEENSAGKLQENRSTAVKDSKGKQYGRYFISWVRDGKIVYQDLTHAEGLTDERCVELINKVETDFPSDIETEAETETETEEGLKAAFSESVVSSIQGSIRSSRAEKILGSTFDMHISASVMGYVEEYIYCCILKNDGAVGYVFLDVQGQISAGIRILLVNYAAGSLIWCLVLLLTVQISRRAVEPVASNLRRQQEFFTNAGHEIKTPLAVILANCDVQELHTGKTKWIGNIRTQALRLSDLSRQMLTLSRMEERRGEALMPSDFDLGAEILETLRVFREPAGLRGLEIRTDVAEGVLVYLPRELIRELGEILFDNGVKYAREGGFLEVELRSFRRTVSFVVRNNCDELPNEPEKLFERFYREDKSRSRQSGGSGIGLSLAWTIVEDLGGTIEAHNLIDKVIEFAVELPKQMRQTRDLLGTWARKAPSA